MIRIVGGSLLATFSSRLATRPSQSNSTKMPGGVGAVGLSPRRHQTADASQSLSFDHLRLVCLPFTAMAIAFLCPTMTTSRLPRVTAV